VAQVIRSILAHAADPSHPVSGALVFLDQEKAYDRVSHDYLFAVLDRFGFPPSLQLAFASTFTNTTTYVLDDGFLVGPIPVACGVRQGDPLAPLLFNLCFEPLLIAMRVRLTGLRLPWGVFHDSAYADDSHFGTAPSDGTSFKNTIDQYFHAGS